MGNWISICKINNANLQYENCEKEQASSEDFVIFKFSENIFVLKDKNWKTR